MIENESTVKLSPARRGKFRISSPMLRNCAHELLSVFAHVVPTRVEYIFSGDVIEVNGISHYFDEVPEPEESPRYDALLREVDGLLTLSFERWK